MNKRTPNYQHQSLVECEFSLPRELLKALEGRSGNNKGHSLSRVLQFDLEVYYSILESGLRDTRLRYSRNEICSVIHSIKISNKHQMERITKLAYGTLAASIDSALRDRNLQLAKKWGIDERIILKKISKNGEFISLTMLELCRLAWQFRATCKFSDIVNVFTDQTKLIEPFIFAYHFGKDGKYEFVPYDGKSSIEHAYKLNKSLNIKYKKLGFDRCQLMLTVNDLDTFIKESWGMSILPPLEEELQRQNNLLSQAGRPFDLAQELQKVMLQK